MSGFEKGNEMDKGTFDVPFLLNIFTNLIIIFILFKVS